MLYAAIEQAPSEEVVEEEVAQRYLARCGWVGVRLPSSVSPRHSNPTWISLQCNPSRPRDLSNFCFLRYQRVPTVYRRL